MRRGKFVGKSIDALRSRRRFPLATFVSLQTARLFGKNTLGAGPSFLAGRSLQGVAWAMLSRLSTATSAVAGGGRSGALVRGARLPRLRGPQEHRQPRWMRIRAGAGADSALLDSDWADLLEGGDGLGTWSLRGGQVPSTSPEPSLPTSPESRGSGRVLLYRFASPLPPSFPFCRSLFTSLILPSAVLVLPFRHALGPQRGPKRPRSLMTHPPSLPAPEIPTPGAPSARESCWPWRRRGCTSRLYSSTSGTNLSGTLTWSPQPLSPPSGSTGSCTTRAH